MARTRLSERPTLSLRKGLLATLSPVLAGWILVALYASRFSAEAFVQVTGLGAFVGAAALLAGGLLGFLFGIPRTNVGIAEDAVLSRTLESGRSLPRERSPYLANTNLEQISDWLTKILVGAGLTQLGTLGRGFGDLTATLDSGLGAQPGGRVLAGALLVYFGTGGFLAGFLLTRLHLGGALRKADDAANLAEAAFEAISEGDSVAAEEFLGELVRTTSGTAAATGVADSAAYRESALSTLSAAVPEGVSLVPGGRIGSSRFDGVILTPKGERVGIDIKYGESWTGRSLLSRIHGAQSAPDQTLGGLLLISRREVPGRVELVRGEVESRFGIPVVSVVAGNSPTEEMFREPVRQLLATVGA